MDTVSSFLIANRDRFELDAHGVGEPISTVVVTPRFRASAHVVVLVLHGDGERPALVAKIPRLPSGDAGIRHEAAALRALHVANPEARSTAPKLVACEKHRGQVILVETAITGRPLDRSAVRRDRSRACDAALAWLAGLERSTVTAPGDTTDWYRQQIERPLVELASRIPFTAEEASALDRTLELAAPLAGGGMSPVFEHGDLSHPNIFVQDSGELGVIDWETAESDGLPLSDLFFFLEYAAAACADASSNEDHVRAWDDAFLAPRAWARPYVQAGARRLGIATESLTPLVVAAALRRVARYASRVSGGVDGPLSSELAEWLRSTRHFHLWRHALDNVDRLVWDDTPRGLRLAS